MISVATLLVNNFENVWNGVNLLNGHGILAYVRMNIKIELLVYKNGIYSTKMENKRVKKHDSCSVICKFSG